MHLAEIEQTELIRVHVNFSIIFLPGLISDAGKPKSPLYPTTDGVPPRVRGCRLLQIILLPFLSPGERTPFGPF